MTLRRLAWMGALAIALPAGAGASGGGVAEREATKLVAKATDPVSGAEIRVFTGDEQELLLEVQDERVFISKLVRPSGIELKVRVGGDAITIALAAGRDGAAGLDHRSLGDGGRVMSVIATAGRVVVAPGAEGDLAKARALIGRSPAVERAVSLLGRVRVRQDSPLHLAILTTRAWLESATGPSAAAAEISAWNRGLRQQRVARRVAVQQGPGDCWDQYAKEAIRIATDYEECLKDLSWYEIFDAMACATVYDVRALGAFAWWLKCIGAMGLV